MSGATSIQWTDATWNPVRGCARVSAGCERCYAERVAHRFSGPGLPYEGLTISGSKGPRWSGKITLVPEVLDQPLRWRKPRRIFVNSMSDLFHEDVPDEFIDRVFAVMAFAERHTFQILTKRPDRMREHLAHPNREEMVTDAAEAWLWEQPERWRLARIASETQVALGRGRLSCLWPLENVWLGVSCEDQAAADERIPILLETPAAVRFLSVEPAIGPIDLGCVPWPSSWERPIDDVSDGIAPLRQGGGDRRGLDWIIVGGESGPGSRVCDVGAVRSIVEQCAAAGVACFVKQLGARPYLDVIDNESHGEVSSWFGGARVRWNDSWEAWLPRLHSRSGSDPSEWPEDLRVRQFPKQAEESES